MFKQKKANRYAARSNFIRRNVKKHLEELETPNSSLQIKLQDLQQNESLPCSSSIEKYLVDESEVIDFEIVDDRCKNEAIGFEGDTNNVKFTNGSFSQLSSSDENDGNDYYPSCSSEGDANEHNKSLQDLLATWSVKHNIRHTALSDLLVILGRYHSLPKDARTVLKTKKLADIIPMYDIHNNCGKYVYLGLEKQLIKLLESANKVTTCGDCCLKLQFSIDELPLFKSSAKQFWPILCSVNYDGTTYKPFVVSLFCGNSKPSTAEVFLSDFVAEVKKLKDHGFVTAGSFFTIAVNAFICDAPARAFVKGITSHNGYYGCERCFQVGEYVQRRVTFPEFNAEKRTDTSFINRQQKQHHQKNIISSLLELNIGHVSQFPLEYMHLVCLGATRKLLLYWLRGSRNVKISVGNADTISNNMISLVNCIPCEFSRKPRSLKEISRWKATEFRLFLCYVGPVVLKNHLPSNIYHHFMLLNVAISILANPDTSNNYCNYAEKLLKIFVKELSSLYGDSSLSYTMHSLIHICDDVRLFGTLDNYSAFPFENMLGSLKKMVRTGRFPLRQLCQRLSEQSFVFSDEPPSLKPSLCKTHHHGPTLTFTGIQYKQLNFAGCFFSTENANRCALLNDGKVIVICNIIDSEHNGIIIICRIFKTMKNLYSYPCESSKLNVFKVDQLSEQYSYFPLSSIFKKCLLL
ncbi:uncharacterized protein LOC136085550 [Hydra vulgaris]|uniref:Uncharacterized protein LOC136085550 n=1 Tax=Hydra vulgaris TaxID=6087 RepID=A0ABM4CM98_HYDVU